jgi:hypothetical protein
MESRLFWAVRTESLKQYELRNGRVRLLLHVKYVVLDQYTTEVNSICN